MEVNGIAHIFLTASNFKRSREFYRKLLPFLGMKPVIDSDTSFYCVGGRTAIGINAPAAEHAGAAFEQNRVWAPGYYSLLYEDPDGIRLELNHVPGKVLLA